MEAIVEGSDDVDVEAPRGLRRVFGDVEDPRVERTRLHRLSDILNIALRAVICGADSWTEIELFGKAKFDWLRTFLGLPHGIPSHDTFGRVLSRLDPEPPTTRQDLQGRP